MLRRVLRDSCGLPQQNRRTVMVVIWVACDVCHGVRGWYVNGKMVICTRCGGAGEVKKIV